MIKEIEVENIVEDRDTLSAKPDSKFDNKMSLLSEAEYQKLSDTVKTNGTTFLTYKDSEE